MPDALKRCISIVLLVGAVLFGISRCNPWDSFRQMATESYQPVQGTILKVLPDETHPGVEYSYVVGGRRFFSDQFSLVKTDGYFEFDEIVGNKKPGDAITVYMAPGDPQHCVLLRGLSNSGWFSLIWLGGVSLGCGVAIYRWCALNRSRADHRQRLHERTEVEDGVLRLRLVPCNFTPLTAGIACASVMAVFTFLALAFADGFDGWKTTLTCKMILSFLVGLATGTFDYYYTLWGNQKGRWDLIVDLNQGTVQIPAVGAFGQPNTLKIEHTRRVTCDVLVSPDDSDETSGIYQLHLHCEQEAVRGQGELQVSMPLSTKHLVAVGQNQTELEALAEMIRDALGLATRENQPGSDARQAPAPV